MERPAQAPDDWCRRVFRWLNPRAGVCVAAALLCGCGTAGFSLESAAVDRSIQTASVAAGPVDTIRASDETTIRNAVSSAIVEEIGEGGIGWANAQTGSRGTIRDVRETRESDLLCRRFTASRESFDGVHLHRGAACLDRTRNWAMKSFERVE